MMPLTIDPAVSLALALAISMLTFAAAFHKACDLKRFAGTVDAYEILPRGAGVFAGPMIAMLEAAVAAALLVPMLRAQAAIAAAFLFAGYGAAIAFNIKRGRRDIDCGCSFGASRSVISESHIVRNAALILGALAVAIPIGTRSLGIPDFVTAVLFTVAAAAIYAALEAAFANAAKAQLSRRAR